MNGKITRRDALKLGTSAALSAATPLFGAAAETTQGNNPSSNTSSDSSEELVFRRAVDLVEMIRTKKVSSREVMQAHLKQIARVNGKVNALVSLVPEDDLMAQAA